MGFLTGRFVAGRGLPGNISLAVLGALEQRITLQLLLDEGR